jgi:ankyrin repeat protein
MQQQPGSKNAVDKFSLTPLHMACMHGKRGCVQLLLRHNVAVDPMDKVNYGVYIM